MKPGPQKGRTITRVYTRGPEDGTFRRLTHSRGVTLWTLKVKDKADRVGTVLFFPRTQAGWKGAWCWVVLNMSAYHLYLAFVRKVERKGKLESHDSAATSQDQPFIPQITVSLLYVSGHVQWGYLHPCGVAVKYQMYPSR